ncbi:MAG TPA: DNA polymerase IV [Acidimicrobiia bacterium]|nr:DNA polymerase IV [Acidimicrobiia bacterium]
MPAPPAILHVDLDAFYASVEQRADPSLRGRPVIVGGLGPRGVVAAASYEARRYGVQSATPMGRARRACPDGVFLAPRFDAYREASAAVMAILRDVTPLVEAISLDEAFLDTTGATRRRGTGPEIAAALRARIRAETELTASVGVGTTKLIAKLASDLAKPDGMLVVEAGTELDFLAPLDVARLWGVGPATGRRLERLGVRTVGDLARIPRDALQRTLGQSSGAHLHALARNEDDRPVEPARTAKSIGHEETFPTDVTDRAALEGDVDRYAERVAARLREVGVVARTVVLKVRYGDFRTITRSRTMPEPTDLADELGAVGQELLRGVDLRDGLRLLGLSAQQLSAVAASQAQLPLGDAPGPDRPSRGDLERAVDDVRRRFGDAAVRRAPSAARP